MRLSLALAIFAAQAIEARACSCARLSFDETFSRAPVVVEGRVVDLQKSVRDRTIIARVTSTRWIKGIPRVDVFVVTTSVPGLCGYPLTVDRTYTFGGDFDNRGRLATNMCIMVPLNPSARP
jgi:hypothetical protein